MLLVVCLYYFEAQDNLLNFAISPDEAFKVTKDVVGKLLEPAKSVLDVLNVVSQIHPAAAVRVPLDPKKLYSRVRKGCRWSFPGMLPPK
jgi:hypothetical protein